MSHFKIERSLAILLVSSIGISAATAAPITYQFQQHAKGAVLEVPPAPAGPSLSNLEVTPPSVNFGPIAIGIASSATVTLKNKHATASAVVTVANATAPFTIAGSNCAGSLGPGETCTVSLSFTPTAVQTYSGFSLPVTFGAKNESVYVPLTGSGTPPTIGSGSVGSASSGDDVTFVNNIAFAQSGYALTTGKWYFEFNNISYGGPYEPIFGITPLSLPAGMLYLGYPSPANGIGWYPSGSNGHGCQWTSCQFGSTLRWADLAGIGIAVDVDAKTIRWFAKPKGGVCVAVGITTGITTPTPWVPSASSPAAAISATVRFNMGQRPFDCAIPAGYAPVSQSQ